jgi:hypothetical protein
VAPNGSGRAAGVPLGAEFALALAVGAVSFTVLAVVLANLEPGTLVAVIGAAGILAVLAVERQWGIAYAVPAGMAGLVAYDWFVFPPTHRPRSRTPRTSPISSSTSPSRR